MTKDFVEQNAELLTTYKKESECEWDNVQVYIYRINIKNPDGSVTKERVKIEKTIGEKQFVNVATPTENSLREGKLN